MELTSREIPLTKGMVSLVDVSDYEYLSQFRWYAQQNSTQRYYAARRTSRNDGNHLILMHREVLGLAMGDSRVVDHVDPSMTLDNRRANLRIASSAQNRMNTLVRRDNVLGIKGVHLHRPGQFRAKIRVYGKQIHLGLFPTPQLAHAAYCEAAKVHFGEYWRAS